MSVFTARPVRAVAGAGADESAHPHPHLHLRARPIAMAPVDPPSLPRARLPCALALAHAGLVPVVPVHHHANDPLVLLHVAQGLA